MRKAAAAVLAVPVLASIYVPVLLRRSMAFRIATLATAIGLFGGVAWGVMPRGTAATPPSAVTPTVEARLATTLQADQPLDGSVTVEFTNEMDTASVEAALSVQPAVPVTVSWTTPGRTLVVAPERSWTPATYFTVTIAAGAKDLSGAALAQPLRAAFLTRPATTGQLAPSARVGKRVPADASVELTFDRPVNVEAAETAFSISPSVVGTFQQVDGSTATTLVFDPETALKPDTAYTIRLGAGVVDADGGALAAVKGVRFWTVAAPAVVRFRPIGAAIDVPRAQIVSVRFTHAMDQALTARAFRVLVNGTSVKGDVSWAEDDTVLVFEPVAPFPYGAKVTLKVQSTARSADGAQVEAARGVTFTVEKKPAAPKAQAETAPTRATAPSDGGAGDAGGGSGSGGSDGSSAGAGGGESVGGGAWAAVERYYLGLLNCTRTGGWVSASGECTSPGGRDVEPLILDQGISNKVSRPYAKYLATHGACDHFLDGNPGDRLARAGYTSYVWAENIGCPSGDPTRGAVATQTFFQSEKPYNGGHWVNLMNPAYDRVGIGVWVDHGRVRIVTNFYHP